MDVQNRNAPATYPAGKYSGKTSHHHDSPTGIHVLLTLSLFYRTIYVRQSDDVFHFQNPSLASCTLASIVPPEIESESMLISILWASLLRISLSYSSKGYFSEATTSQPLHGLLSNNTSCDHILRLVYLANGRKKSTLLFPTHQNSLLSAVVLASWSKTNSR